MNGPIVQGAPTGRKIVVTGAFGKVGLRTVMYLLAAGHKVVAVEFKNHRTHAVWEYMNPYVEIVWGDIRDEKVWDQALPGADTVIHLAAIIPPAVDRNPGLAMAVNTAATVELVRKMEASPTAKRLIFASSMVVAGHEQHLRTPPLKVDEVPRAVDTYGVSKIEAEKGIQSSSLKWSILRLAVVMSTDFNSAEMGSFDAMFEASPEGRIEVVHDDDAGLAFSNAASCDAAIGKILFIGGGERCRSIAIDFYNRFFMAMGLMELNPNALRPGPAYFYGDWLDTSESQALLKFQRKTLNQIISDLRANLGIQRWFIRLLSPIIKPLIERRSPHRARKGRAPITARRT